MSTTNDSQAAVSRSQRQGSPVRRRLFGGAAAVAVLIGAVSAWQVDASSSDGASFVPVAPCRLFDTRPGAPPADTTKSPVGAGDAAVRTQQVTGAVGDCMVPADAVAVSMNVTAVNGTAQSNLRLFPADVATPTASNLNWVAGQSPTPNKVDVQLSTGGAVKLFNQNGTVDVVADVVGYYTPNDLDVLRTQVSELATRLQSVESKTDNVVGRFDDVEDRTAFSVSSSDATGVEIEDDARTILELDLTAPVDGEVILTHSTQALTFGIGAVLWCGVFKEGEVPPGEWSRDPGVAWTETDDAVSAHEATLTATAAFGVTANVPTTFVLVCERSVPQGGFVSSRTMTAVFTAD
ncbi:MAG: hypothetical protein AAFY28_01970 [Actinomycetota bacterium]